MKSMSGCSMFERLKTAIAKVKADNKKWFPYLLVPMIEEPTVGDAEHHGWSNRQAGMISIRNNYSWHGEVTIALLDNIRPDTRKALDARGPTSIAKINSEQKYRGQFLKPYANGSFSGSEAARQIMGALAEQLETEGWTVSHWHADAGPASTPDRRVSLMLYNYDLNTLATIYCNIIAAEWQDPELAPFRIKGTFYKSIKNHTYKPHTVEELRLFFGEVLPSVSYSSAAAFHNKYAELTAQGWTVHAFTSDGRFYKLFMVDAHKDRVKILFHKM
ncbi:hypothetical protein FDI21_gp286 [Pseudomonas phage Noxifer]|uniref:Uncharacterized protein n=1 Tax=Pseudomonas phage Noxifer TaxID=2006684 RepID=A0A1Y0SXZ3_9CAUD|nr:hypothetical protein FDI21_gp286 [Pseudomonas phage Noxifer]ARV77425.1 hypothetical protein NOXIFER_260 [Pseudomonas phage Noxifer]